MLQHKLLLIMFLGFFAANMLQAQDKVNIKLKQPPPGRLGVADMWNLELNNTSGKDMKIYLMGEAHEEKDGPVATGQSKVFTVKPGKTNYSYKDFSNAEVKYNNSKYKEIILRTGNAPEGTYTICVTAFDEGGEVVGQENCVMQTVRQEGSITLISPEDGAELDPDSVPPMVFSWTPLAGSKDPYSLRIVELKGSQSPDEAMKTGRAFFEKSGLNSTTFQYPLDAPKMETGKKYAWMVLNGSVGSGVNVFSMASAQTDYNLKFTKIVCTNTPGKYDFEMKMTVNPGTSYNPVRINSASEISAISVVPSLAAPIAFTFTNSFPVNISGSYPQTGIITGTFQSSGGVPVTSIMIQVNSRFYYSASGYITKQDVLDTTIANNCNRNCCDGFAKGISNIGITQSSGVTNFSANLSAGPNPIKKVTAEMVYFYQNWNNNICTKCVMDSKYKGNFTNGKLDDFGNGNIASPLLVDYSREIRFNSPTTAGINMSNGKTINLTLALPTSSSLSCCADTIRFCIRFSFTNTDCVTCDTLICRKIIRNSNGIGSGGEKSNEIYLPKVNAENIYIDSNVAKPVSIESKFAKVDKYSFENKEKPKEEFCPGNRFVNGTFENLRPSPPSINGTDNINAAVGWFAIWNTNGGLADLNQQGVGTVQPPTTYPQSHPAGNYASCWINNGAHNEREGMFGELSPISNNSGSYTFTFDMAPLGYLSGKPQVGIYGIYNPGHLIYTGPPNIRNGNTCNGTCSFDPPTVDLFGQTNTVLLGNFDFYEPTDLGIMKQYSVTFPTDDNFPINGITHILITNSDLNNNSAAYVAFDNFCIHETPPPTTNSNCCDGFDINVQTKSNTYWTYSTLNVNVNDLYVNISTGQNRIKKIRAFLTDFTSTYSNDDCKECNNLPFSWASFSGEILSPSTIASTLIPYFTNFSMYNYLTNQNQREVIWVNSNDLSVPPLNNVPFHFYIHLPLNPQLSCCADTIKYCIKYEFTDSTCKTCDTTICYSVILGKSDKVIRGDKEFKREIEKYNEEFKKQIDKEEKKGSSLLLNYDMNESHMNSVGQSELQKVQNEKSLGQAAGVINVDLSKTAFMKLTLFDQHGKELKKIFDDFMMEGKYSFDLNNYGLPDGVYFYRLENDNTKKYEKVLITKPISSCNYGH